MNVSNIRITLEGTSRDIDMDSRLLNVCLETQTEALVNMLFTTTLGIIDFFPVAAWFAFILHVVQHSATIAAVR